MIKADINVIVMTTIRSICTGCLSIERRTALVILRA
jgi:hypothetical protein